MHGLVNRSIECFLRDTYGQSAWDEMVLAADLEFVSFEPMLHYDDAVTSSLLEAIARRLEKPKEAVLEDVGTYLVTHENTRAIRRLLRFGGETFSDFLSSLDDLQDRAHLAVPDLDFPKLELLDQDTGHPRLAVKGNTSFVWVLCGALRALADDYGALVMMDAELCENGDCGQISMHLAELAFAEGNAFSLGAGGNL